MALEYRFGRDSAFQEMEQLRRELDRVFSDVMGPPGREFAGGGFPVNLYASGDECVLTAEIPGIGPEAVEVSVEERVVTVSFERPEKPLPDKGAYHRRERATGRFSRSVELPYRVDHNGAEAQVQRGVLQVRLPRQEADKPKRVQIKAR